MTDMQGRPKHVAPGQLLHDAVDGELVVVIGPTHIKRTSWVVKSGPAAEGKFNVVVDLISNVALLSCYRLMHSGEPVYTGVVC